MGPLALEKIGEGTLQMERKMSMPKRNKEIKEGSKSNVNSKYVSKCT